MEHYARTGAKPAKAGGDTARAKTRPLSRDVFEAEPVHCRAAVAHIGCYMVAAGCCVRALASAPSDPW